MNIQLQVYAVESAVEVAVQRVLDLLNTTVLTPSDAPELQRARPRCEVVVDIHDSYGPLWPEAVARKKHAAGSLREMGFNGKCRITIITIPSIEIHDIYRAMIRSTAATMIDRANFNFLKYHQLQLFKTASTDYYRDAAGGYYRTDITFDIKVSIQADAIALVIAAEQPAPIPVPVAANIFLRNQNSTAFRALHCDFEGVVNVPYLGDATQAQGNAKVLIKNESDGLYYELYCSEEAGVPVFAFVDDPDFTAEFQVPVYITNDTDGLVYELRCRFDGDNAIVPYLLPT